jgi:hypothetical protein
MPDFPSTTSASGIWTLKKHKRAKQGSNWPDTVDPYFPYVTMLLPSNGTNGAQNNTFLDSSTNNFTITRNGNVTQGTFTPYGSNWSNYFDGAGDYLTVPSNAALAVGSTFTVECWVYRTVGSTIQWLAGNNAGSGNTKWLLEIEANNTVYGGGWGSGTQTVSTVPVAAWTHIAMVCDSGSLKIYIDGIQSGTAGSGANFTAADITYIGQYSGASRNLTGYISNLRVLKGTALYTANFTPPTAPLTAITNTSLLTCQSNRFIDNSSNNFTITRNGDTSVQVFSPFSPTASYAAGTNGGSGYFDGSGDNLYFNGTAIPATGDFTIEAWVYPLTTASHTVLSLRGSAYSLRLEIGGGGSGAVDLLIPNTAASNWLAIIGSFPAVFPPFAWHHIAAVRNGGTYSVYANGVRVATTTAISPGTALPTDSNNYIGGTAYPSNAYISNVRCVNGTALYTGTTYTVPTSPFTAISGTSLLCNFTNAGVIDNAMMNNLETVGNAQISTTQSKWDGSSIAFDGTGDWLLAPSSPNFAIDGNFTVEMWVYFNNTTLYAFFDMRGIGNAAPNNPALFWSNSASKIQAYINNDFRITSGTLNTAQWYHVALTRSGTTVTLYVDGVSQGTYTYSASITQQALYVGTGAGLGSFNGYIDDLRITKGFARYTANFTPPTGPFFTR